MIRSASEPTASFGKKREELEARKALQLSCRPYLFLLVVLVVVRILLIGVVVEVVFLLRLVRIPVLMPHRVHLPPWLKKMAMAAA